MGFLEQVRAIADRFNETGKDEALLHRKIEQKVEFPVEVIRTRRKKTVAIKIVEGRVQVIAPKRLSQKRIDELVYKKASWICEKLRIQSEMLPVESRQYVSGESFAYLGKTYPLKLICNDVEDVKLKRGQFVLAVDNSLSDEQRAFFVREQLVRWYQEHAEQRLSEKVACYASIVGVVPRSLIVKTYKSRWGSCSIHGDISFNWKIIIAPNRVVDYVVIHELCHMHQHNHSRKFWDCVERVMPDYKQYREWLKSNEKYLDV